MLLRTALSLAMVVSLVLSAAATRADEAPGGTIRFKKIELDRTFRSEGVAIGDFNNDGLLDVAAGSVYYAAPDWKMHLIAEEAKQFDPRHYSDSFCNFAVDINGNGWLDLIVVDFPGKETWWFENPRGSVGPWKRHVLTPETNNESPDMHDITGDGRRELILGIANGQMAIARPSDDPYALWDLLPISTPKAPGTNRFSHGLGVGDINGNGRNDVVVPEGWWEHPADGRTPWKFHPAPLGEPCAHMYVYDFDGDGDNDVLSSSAHAYGVWWHEQTPEGWKTHEIATDFSQTHSMCMADINGDGLPDFVTGKRWWAHAEHDPGAKEDAVLYWFELTRKDGRPVWIRHLIDHDSGVGTQFEIGDINGDGLLDIVTANKKGARIFLQQREEPAAGQ